MEEGKGAGGGQGAVLENKRALQGLAPEISCISGALQHFGAFSWR